MRTQKEHWSSGWAAAAIALLVAAGAVAPSAQGRSAQGPQRRADRADRQLAERLNQGDGSDGFEQGEMAAHGDGSRFLGQIRLPA